MKQFVLATSLLVGTIVGAGIFSLPFVFSQAGIVGGILFGVVVALIAICVLLMYADLILDDHSEHRIMGLARYYFGKKGFFSLLFVNGLGTLFVLTTYIVLSVSFLKIFFTHTPFLILALLFWLISFWAIFLRIKNEAQLEFFATIGIGLVIVMILGFGLSHLEEFSLSFSPFSPFLFILPIGAFLFSLGGRAVIPDVVAFLGEEKKKVRQVISTGVFVSLALYFVFVIGVVSMSDVITQDGVSGLVKLPWNVQVIMGVLGIFALWSSFISNGSDLFRSFRHDVGLSRIAAGALVSLIPIVLVFVGFDDFLMLVSIVGGLFLAVEWSSIVMMWIAMRKKKPQEVSVLGNVGPSVLVVIFLVLCIAIVYTIYTTLFF